MKRMRGSSLVTFITRMGFARFGGSKSWKERPGTPASLSDLAPFGHGTRGSQLHHDIPGRDDNQAPDGGFGRPQHTQHGAVQGPWNPRSRICAIKPQQGEQDFNDALERLAVAFDGQVPVHVVPILRKEQNRNIFGILGI